MRYLYTILLYAALPWVFLRLWLKGRRSPGYRDHWRERLGHLDGDFTGAIWIHAVSVGEVRAAAPLLHALRERYPDHPLVITTTTPTGRLTAETLYGVNIVCCYLPYDLPRAVNRFLESVRPALCVIMEVEIWPNLFAAVHSRSVPLFLVNARLSDSSYRGYKRSRGLMRETLGCITSIATQGERDRDRFLDLGVSPGKVSVAGNLKLDVGLPVDFEARTGSLRSKLESDRPLWVAGSTHEGEESIALDVHAQLLEQFPEALLILAPRHPERSNEVVKLCRSKGLSYRHYSETDALGDDLQVLIVDELGVLVYCYGIADAAFIGGSLADHGGHNPVEAVLAGTPVISGPGIGNGRALYDRLQGAGVARIVQTGDELLSGLRELLNEPGKNRQLVEAGRSVVGDGALSRVLQLIGGAMK